MNITEEQVRDVLEKHGMGGWSTYSDSEKLILMPGAPRQPISLVASANGALIEDLQIHAASKDYEATWHSHVYPAIRDLITLLSEPTLQEQVEEVLKPFTDVMDIKVTDQSVEFLENSNHPIRYFVKADEISYEPQGMPNSRNTFTVREYRNNYGDIPEINAALPKIAALLSPPSLESQIAEQQRVIEGLREELKTEGDKWAQSFKILKDKNLALEEQLQGCVSQADHQTVLDKHEMDCDVYEGLLKEAYDRISTYQFGVEEAYKQIQREREQQVEMPF